MTLSAQEVSERAEALRRLCRRMDDKAIRTGDFELAMRAHRIWWRVWRWEHGQS